ncbi:SRPBCC domain-containing protein [uncultured Eudoraea sp.]|uniref:SRPBCC domain-containing protein n=1 Tax=uncultured Eudoraea sp. TaxID=1035614 RepID=UPI00261ECDCD|nr:SRPBCC domain-containing protein [uncultured Eudoraea sp.]
MKESFELRHNFKAKPSEIYDAWLDSIQHSEMTGGPAKCSNIIGGKFTAWDGYIEGKNIELKPNKEIIQSWRTSEFGDNDKDSKLIIQLKESENGTELILNHSNIPEGQTQYKKGWLEHYFIPMENYFKT